MYSHIVVWNIKEPKEKSIEFLSELLLSMKEKIPQIVDVQVGANIDSQFTNRDFVLMTTHNSKEDIYNYQNHPYHLEVKEKVSPYLSERVCIDTVLA